MYFSDASRSEQNDSFEKVVNFETSVGMGSGHKKKLFKNIAKTDTWSMLVSFRVDETSM